MDFEFHEDRFSVLDDQLGSRRSLTDAQIGLALDNPINSPPLEELIEPDDSILIVVSDATRATGSAQIVNLLVRRVIQYGVPPEHIAIIFATGIHRRVNEEEKNQLLTPFIVQRIASIDHDPGDPGNLISLGMTSRGTPILVNKALVEFSKVILTGAVGFHYFAGFTGGRKSVCPGLASIETIEKTHVLALDTERGGRRAGVGTGLLDGNPVHEECEAVAALISPAFGVNVIVENNEVKKIFCGNWRSAHRAACADYLENHSIAIPATRDLVMVSCGGYPYDINLIQAHKALEMASFACKEGGSIILVAECSDGLGRDDFLKWFECDNSAALEARLWESYEVNGQTAWSLLRKAERYRVYLVSSLANETVKKMRMTPVSSIADGLSRVNDGRQGYIMTHGASRLPRLTVQ